MQIRLVNANSTGVLFLITKNEGDTRWRLPSADLMPGDTLRETVERACYNTLGNDFNPHFVGYSPMTFQRRRFPKELRDRVGIEGVKNFIFRAHHLADCEISPEEEALTWEWARAEDLPGRLSSSLYHRLKPCILNDTMQHFEGTE